MKYGRLKNNGNSVEIAPAQIRANGKLYVGNIPHDAYVAAGWFPIKPVAKPADTVDDGYEIVDGFIQRKYRAYTPEEQEEIEGMRIVPMTKEEAEAYENMEQTIAEAQSATQEAQAAAEAAQAEAETAQQEAAEAMAAKEAAEAAQAQAEADLADVSEIIEKVEELANG